MKNSGKSAISVVVTVLNEAKTINSLLAALAVQTLVPQEVLIVDGGSTDETLVLAQNWVKKSPFELKIVTQKGNRSLGRNWGIREAQSDWIAITDAGCIPHPNWLAQLAAKQTETEARVIAGYYEAQPQTPFEEAVVPYALVMPDRVDPDHFLPATRSMLLEKTVWQELGGFDENLSDNEDFAFAKKIEKYTIPRAFAQKAKVIWQPRSDLRSFWTMIYRFARGDSQAKILRPKVVLIFARYGVVAGLLLLGLWGKSIFFYFLLIFCALYIVWSIAKNRRYAPNGWYWLPVLQITSDVAVMLGTVAGLRR